METPWIKNIPLKINIWLLLAMCFSDNTFGQSIISGEYIVHIQQDYLSKNTATWYKSISEKYTDIVVKKLCDEPLELWLVTNTSDVLEKTTAQFEKDLNRLPGVKNIAPNRRLSPRTIPDDSLLNNQWQYVNTGNGSQINADLDADKAWDFTTGGVTPLGDTIVICVVDNGANIMHPDLTDNTWVNHHEIPNNGIDDDGNGYIDDYRGWDVRSLDDNVGDTGDHGTPVAGIIGAKGNNRIGVTGVNWDVKLMIVDYGNNATEANALASYAYPYTMRKLYNETNGAKGAFVVATNSSWGVDKVMPSEAPFWCAIYDSLGSVGILNCGATSNSNTNVDEEGDLPTSCPSPYLISVTNINRQDVKLSSAGYGIKSIDLGSYGHQVYTLSQNSYGTFGGTSGATPHVTGAIGLIYALQCPSWAYMYKNDPALAARMARDFILFGVQPLSALDNITVTGGKLNLHNVLYLANMRCEGCPLPAGIQIETGDETRITWVDPTATPFKARYRVADVGEWVDVEDILSPYIIHDLPSCQEIEFQIFLSCGLNPDTYSHSFRFESPGCCLSPALQPIRIDSEQIILAISGSTNAQNTISLTGGESTMTTQIGNDTILFTGLTECRLYHISAVASCQDFGTSSLDTSNLWVSTYCPDCTDISYCTFGIKDNTGEWIQKFALGSAEWESGKGDNSYAFFGGALDEVYFAGETYALQLSPGFDDIRFSEYFYLYLDGNKDGAFDDDELLYYTITPSTQPIITNIAMPHALQEGYTRMRLIMSYDDLSSSCDVADFEYGEIEDYCIYVQNTNCLNIAKPNFVTVNDTILMVADTSKQQVELRMRVHGTEEWTTQLTFYNDVLIEGLSPCTLYDFQYRTICNILPSLYSQTDTIRVGCRSSVNTPVKSDVVIYPNPNYSGIITINNPYGDVYNMKATMRDVYNNDVKIHLLYKNATSAFIYIDQDVPSGMYLLQVASENITRTYTLFYYK